MNKVVFILLSLNCVISAGIKSSSLMVDFSAGSPYTFYGVKLSYDSKLFGAALLYYPRYGLNNFSASFSGNLYIAEGSIVLGPQITVGHREGSIPFYYSDDIECYYVGSAVNAKGYFTNKFFVRHLYGFKLAVDKSGQAVLPRYGVGLGFDFFGGYKHRTWSRRQMFVNGIAFGSGILLPLLMTFPVFTTRVVLRIDII